MDRSKAGRFAQMVQAASRRHARRTALGGAAVATAGMLASGLGGDAKKKKRKKKCPKCKALAAGAACETNQQCCPNETNRVCNFPLAMPGPVCCGALGATCASDPECCRNFVCIAGACSFGG